VGGPVEHLREIAGLEGDDAQDDETDRQQLQKPVHFKYWPQTPAVGFSQTQSFVPGANPKTFEFTTTTPAL
jgi:hypothetical protein